MITGLDHLVLLCSSIEDAEATYSILLDRKPDWRSRDSAGAASVFFQMETVALELLAPSGSGPVARRLHTLLDMEGPRLESMVFATSSINDAHRLCARRGLKPEEIQAGESIDPEHGAARSWSRFRLSDEGTNGAKIFLLQRGAGDPLTYKPAGEAAASTLDHVVINTFNPDRALALYGAKLGLNLALDRSNPDWDARLMFFRTGGSTVEVAHKLSKGESSAPDKLWGLSWRVPNIEAAHDRLKASGLQVSDTRPGRRPGSKVFSVKNGTLGVPTLILANETANRAG